MYGWILLFVAIIFEAFGTTAMKLSDGFTNLLFSILIFICYGASFTLFTIALKTIDVSTAYAVWAGLGTVIITFIGIFYFTEPVTVLKMASIIAIIAGVVGLRLAGVE